MDGPGPGSRIPSKARHHLVRAGVRKAVQVAAVVCCAALSSGRQPRASEEQNRPAPVRLASRTCQLPELSSLGWAAAPQTVRRPTQSMPAAHCQTLPAVAPLSQGTRGGGGQRRARVRPERSSPPASMPGYQCAIPARLLSCAFALLQAPSTKPPPLSDLSCHRPRSFAGCWMGPVPVIVDVCGRFAWSWAGQAAYVCLGPRCNAGNPATARHGLPIISSDILC